MSTSSTFGPPAPAEALWSELETIAPGALRRASSADAVDGLMPARVVAPDTEEQVSRILRWANDHVLHVIPRGGSTKLSWGNAPASLELILSLEKMNRHIDHAWQDMTVTVSTGVTLAALQSELASHGQRLPLDALWPERATIGGVIAANDNGSLRLRFGSLRDLLLGVTAILPNGTIARSGGRVVKNVAGYDLPKLFIGSFGTLGVLTEATLRTYPLPHSVQDLSFRFPDAPAANRFMLAIADTNLVPVSMQLRIASQEAPIVDLRLEGLPEGIEAQVRQATRLAASGTVSSSGPDIWQREPLFAGDSPLTAKFSVLPSQIAAAAEAILSYLPKASISAQSIGLGTFRVDIVDPDQAIQPVSELRMKLRSLGGTLVFLQAPPALKKVFDVFGERTSSYPLMVRIKQQFDPKGTLSPGRFLGGI